MATSKIVMSQNDADMFTAAEPALDMADHLLPLLPLKNVVILPRSVVPIIAGRDFSIKAVEYALKHDRTVFITTQKDHRVETPGINDVYTIGTRAAILQVMRMPNGSLKVLAEGMCRARITNLQSLENFLAVSAEDVPTTGAEQTPELEAAWRELTVLYQAYAQLNEKAPVDLLNAVQKVEDMDHIADTIAIQINTLGFTDRQEILEEPHLVQRIIKLCKSLQKEIDILQAESRIRGHIQTQVERNQKEYYLTEQIKAIQKELGREDQAADIDALRQKAKAARLSAEAMEKVEKELRRLEQMPPLSAEASVSRNYVEWILSLPWHQTSKDNISLTQAIKILDKNHAGLKKPKERIIEFLAAKKFSENLSKSPVLCLAGAPGVGKTSLARVIAESLGREFVRIALGGVRDEAEIRGHRRTYIGALPGNIIQGLKKAKTVNPVILLDEIDKVSRDLHGDPAAALLEVLDPEQNKHFVDHFLDVEYDLSKVMFIATANTLDNIPYPLFDRLEIIQLSGYTEEEKLHIAQQFLMPRNLKEHSLKASQCKISESLFRILIDEYTREAGVRQLDRIIAKIMRKTIQALCEHPEKKSPKITLPLIRDWLGNATCKKTSLNPTEKKIGLTIGLAWTELGGDVLEIETAILPGKGSLNLTGQLGEVMQESAQAALSYIRSRAQALGLSSTFHNSKDIHIHMPEGATPKDGPSAGITICTALVSALTDNPTKNSLAMTGEITLQGRVLAIGGLKEKLLSAKQHGITTVIIPHENNDDLIDIQKDTNLDGINIIQVKNMDEVLAIAFVEDPFVKAKKLKEKKKKDKLIKKKTKASA